MKNYICIDGTKTKLDPDLSMETAKNKLKGFLEECKPKELRHGDYGYYKSGGFWWAWRRKGILELFGRVEGSGRSAQDIYDNTDDMVKLGNHIADLKRNAEDLKEFTVSDKDGTLAFEAVKQRDFDTIWLKIHHKSHGFFNFDQATEIAKGILQEVATALRNKAEKDC